MRRWIFALLGVGSLVPWNAFISAQPYFAQRFCELDINVESVFAILYNLSSVTSLSILLTVQWLQRRQQALMNDISIGDILPEETEVSPSLEEPSSARGNRSTASISTSTYWQVMVPLTVFGIIFIVQYILVDSINISPNTLWHITTFSLVLCGFVGSIGQAGLVTAGAAFGVIDAFMQGQSLGGVLVAFGNAVAAWWNVDNDYSAMHCHSNSSSTTTTAVPYDESSVILLETDSSDHTCVPYLHTDWGIALYFLGGFLILIACLVGYTYLVWWHPRDQAPSIYGVVETDSERGNVSMRQVTSSTLLFSEINEDDDGDEVRSQNSQEQVDTPEEELPGVCETDAAVETGGDGSQSVWSSIWGPATCIFVTFTVTLSLFPSWTSSLTSVYSCRTKFRWSNEMYVPGTFLIFNVCDLAGRLLTHRISLTTPRELVQWAFARLVFIPLFFACESEYNRLSISSDLYSFIVQCLFGLSNGFLVTSAFVMAPCLLSDIRQQDQASTLLTLAVSLGLMTGSILSLPVTELGSLL